REEILCHFVADHYHRNAERRLLGRECPAAVEVVFLDREIIAIDCVRLDLLRPGVLSLSLEEILALHGDAGAGWEDTLNEGEIGVVHARPAQPAAPFFLRPR